MSALVLRTVVLVAVLAIGAGVVRVSLRAGRRRVALPVGVVLVNGPGCALCEPAARALRTAGVEPKMMDIAEARPLIGPVASLPTALVVGEDGAVITRRSGRAVLTDVAALAAAARGSGPAYPSTPANPTPLLQSRRPGA